MSVLLQGLDQQAFGSFDRDPGYWAVTAESTGQIPQSGDIVRDLALFENASRGVKHTQLVMSVAPVNADEHSTRRGRLDR